MWFASSSYPTGTEREFFIDNLLVRIHFIIVMIRWTGLAPWEFESPFPGSLISTFLVPDEVFGARGAVERVDVPRMACGLREAVD